jgi:DNA-binding NarL/FixJ family response regulator
LKRWRLQRGQGHLRQAARLWGAASAVRDEIHALLPPAYQADYAPFLAKVRDALGEQAFATAWAEGRAMTLDEAIALAKASPTVEPEAVPPTTRPTYAARTPPSDYGLTPREFEVLRLVANGLTDAQIAEQLVISPRTVGKHLQSIYSKLYLPSRSAATRWAIEHHLG